MAKTDGSSWGAGRSARVDLWFAKVLGVVFLMQLAINAIRPTVSYRALALGASTVQLGLIAAALTHRKGPRSSVRCLM